MSQLDERAVPPAREAAGTDLRVGVGTETGRLRTVIMCLANPWRTPASTLRDVDVAALHQMVRNRWRPYVVQEVREQQAALMEVLRAQGTEVLLADNLHQVSQHYTRDVGFTIDDTFFVARPRRPYRQAEIPGIRRLVARMSTVAWLDDGSVEGGDVMLADGHVLVGLGEETNRAGADAIAHRLAESGSPRRVVPLEFSHRGVVHLDTKFNVVGENLALVHRPSFSRDSLRWLVEHFDLIDCTDEEAANTEINTIGIAPGTVVVQSRSERISEALEDRGVTAVPVDYSAVTRLPGSFRCTTLPILREEPAAGPSATGGPRP